MNPNPEPASGLQDVSAGRMVPLGDQATLVYLPDEQAAFAFANAVRRAKPYWLVEVVQAYTSVAVFFHLDQISSQQVTQALMHLRQEEGQFPGEMQSRLHRIPCCYEMQHDLKRVAEQTGLSPDDVIRLHLEGVYTVYAIGFCPGFPYLGYLPPPLCGIPRLPQPRLRVEAGSVGLTGRQTGIYTEVRPGGWNLIGRTPLQLVQVEEAYFPLRTSDRVRFERIDETEYGKLEGERL